MNAHLFPDTLQRTFMKLFRRVAKPFTHPWKQGDANGLPPTSESRNLHQAGNGSTQRHIGSLTKEGEKEAQHLSQPSRQQVQTVSRVLPMCPGLAF